MTNFVQYPFASRIVRVGTKLTLVLLVLLVIAMTPLASAQTFMFNRADFATGVGPTVVAVGDFNGDGLMDVVTGNGDTANSVSVLLGKGDGTFAAHVDYAVGAAPQSIAVGDFNGDGKLDIIVDYGFENSHVAVLLGNGDGTFKPFIATTAGPQGGGIAIGDFNGDGKLDVAIADNEPPSLGVDIMLGNGDGTFQAPVSYATADNPRMVVVADFNGDKKLDLATVNSQSATVSVLLGNGDGTFQTHQDLSTAKIGGCISLAAADLRNDGNVDIIAGCQSAGEIAVFLSNGNGTFKPEKSYVVPDGVDDIVVADVNGDGKIDVATTNGGNNVSVLAGSGTGTLKAAVAFGTNYGSMGVAAADFNGDGKVDLVTANSGAPFATTTANISVLLSNGKDLFAARTDYSVATGTQTGAYSGIATADLTGNGKLDLVIPISNRPEVSVLINKGTGTFDAPVSYALPVNPQAVALGDFNNDHKMDIVVSNFGGTGSISVLLNSGTGTFPTFTTDAIGGYSFGVAVGDFNKDGNLDIVATDATAGTVSVLLGNGTGAFPTFATYATGSGPYAVTVADFNNDGWPDLAVTNSTAGTISILINKADGSGTFLPHVDYAVVGGPLSIAAGSFRGDGIIDLAVATNQGSGGLAILLGNNNGTFQPAVLYDTLNNAYAVALGDFNNDGNLDVAVSIVNSGTVGYVTLLPGKGDGTFSNQVTLAAGDLPYGIVAADFNHDGGLDLAMDNGTIAGDLGSATLLLNEPVIGIAPTSLTFAAQKVGTTSAAQVITVDNPGSTPLKVTSITISGPFSETKNCPAVLAAGKSCTIDVSFTPTASGAQAGVLSIKDSALTSVQKIALTGTGT
jgi:hypothetical protein